MKFGFLTALVFAGSLSKPLLYAVDKALIKIPRLNFGQRIETGKERRQILRCAAVAGLAAFLHFYYAIPFCVLFTFLTVALLVWLYPFQVADNLLGRFLSVTVYKFDPIRWSGSHKERTKIYPIYLLGISLIVMLPFQHYQHVIDLLHIQAQVPIISPIISRMIENNQTFEFWELAVCLWSLLFLLIFFLRELRGHAERLDLKAGTSVSLGMGGVIIVGACAAFSGYLLLSEKPAEYRIGAELLITGLLCTSDILFYFWYKRKAKELADDFTLFLLVLDGPSLLAFLVLAAYLLFSSAGPSDGWKLPFASGAAALNLVLVNTVFSFLYIIERYRSTPGSRSRNEAANGLAVDCAG
jgi:hypothetical protein